ncbi:hypothetical protein CRYUN_Cryun21dG0062100 [Craigia yunnanensis]
METKTFLLANGGSPLSLTPNYILPQHKRPNLTQISTLASIPIIDLVEPSALVVEQISKACEEYGFFQIINHGIPQELCDRMMAVITDFFELPPEEKAPFLTTDHTKQVKLFNYFVKDGSQNKVSMWSECFSHPWHPLDDILHLLPQNPPQYRDVVAEYAKEIGVLMKWLLSLISQGLGLEKDCLEKKLGDKPILREQGNYYPPCPNPELTLGLNVHTDLNALTIVRQSEGVTGLQVIKDGKWVAVEPIPNAFVINLGDQIQVLSNGRYKSVHHRAVTNETQKRVSVATFYAPSRDAIIGPIKDLIDEQHPPVYREYHYSEFLEEFFKQEGTRRMVKETFELKNY